MRLTTSDLAGTWRVIRTEIPLPYQVGREFFHFSPDGTHLWEMPFIDKGHKVWTFQYTVTGSGIVITNDKPGYENAISLRIEEGCLVATPPHGYQSWWQRIPLAERPDYLAHFFGDSGEIA